MLKRYARFRLPMRMGVFKLCSAKPRIRKRPARTYRRRKPRFTSRTAMAASLSSGRRRSRKSAALTTDSKRRRQRWCQMATETGKWAKYKKKQSRKTARIEPPKSGFRAPIYKADFQNLHVRLARRQKPPREKKAIPST